MIPDLNPPSLDTTGIRTFQEMRDRALSYFPRVIEYFQDYFKTQLLPQLNSDVYGFGADIASAATISFTSEIHLVTGSVTIATINVPTGFTGGGLTLAAKDGFSVTTGGNIALAQTVNAGHAIMLSWHPVQNLWYGVTS